MTDTYGKRIPSTEERADLLRSLSAWTQNMAVAEDLVQQTLIEAWKSDHQPADTEWRPWLFGIARNMFYRWRRDLARDLRSTIAIPESDAVFEATASDVDLDAELERNEVVVLLHDLLDTLPIGTRDILLLKYIDALPQASIASELGLHEKAVEGRLHRGKQLLRNQLLSLRPDSAIELGIVTEENSWQQTTHWCTHCGNHRLVARWSDDGTLRFECPSCVDGRRAEVYTGGKIQSRIPNRRPTFSRVMNFFTTQSNACVRATSGLPPQCPACSNPMQRTIQHHTDPLIFEASFTCTVCDGELHFENLLDCGIDSDAGIAFRQQHPRVSTLPPEHSVFQDRDAILVRWLARNEAGELRAWHDPQLGHLISID